MLIIVAVAHEVGILNVVLLYACQASKFFVLIYNFWEEKLTLFPFYYSQTTKWDDVNVNIIYLAPAGKWVKVNGKETFIQLNEIIMSFYEL